MNQLDIGSGRTTDSKARASGQVDIMMTSQGLTDRLSEERIERVRSCTNNGEKREYRQVLTSSRAWPFAGTAHRGGSITCKGCSRTWQLFSDMMVSSESSDNETAKSDGRSHVTKEVGRFVERISLSQKERPLAQPIAAKHEYLGEESVKCNLSDDVKDVPQRAAPEESLVSDDNDGGGMSERGMAPQRLTFTVIFPMARGIIEALSLERPLTVFLNEKQGHNEHFLSHEAGRKSCVMYTEPLAVRGIDPNSD